MSPVWDDKMRSLYARELRGVGMEQENLQVERWTFTPAKWKSSFVRGKLPKGAPPDGTFHLTIGNPATPFNMMEAKGTLLHLRFSRPGHSVMHIRIYGRRLRVVTTPGRAWIDFSGKEVSWFPRRRHRRMAGK